MEGLFTSESVSEGHPDKLCDQIVDDILDVIISQDKNCRVACNALIKNNLIVIAGEISTSAQYDINSIVRNRIESAGYNDLNAEFNHASCKIITEITQQSPDIAQSIYSLERQLQNAGDQGMVFGYACTETDELMPASILYAHRLVTQLANLRKSGKIGWLRPDAKSQITVRYENDKPIEIDSVVLSTQHCPEVEYAVLVEVLMKEVVFKAIPVNLLTNRTRYFINPSKKFELGGPIADTGMTGRKNCVDSYGSIARDGGGCFSGKDPSKIDRSGAYMARYIAKNIVAAELANRCEIQIAYVIGMPYPIAVHLETFETEKIDKSKILNLITETFDLSPYGIITTLNLLEPIYGKTACYGHFGRSEPNFRWEKIDQTDKLRRLLSTYKKTILF